MGDCFDFLKNNTLSRADLNGENGIARNVHYGDILIKFGDCLDGEQSDLPFITDDTVLPKFAGSILSEGDVIFADTAEDEAAGKCIELRKLPKEPTISGLHTIPARPRFPFGTGYLGHYLNSDAYHRQLLPLMQGIKVISVSKAALQDTHVRFPSLSEQSAIGVALSEIDALITLHQRKRRKRLFTHLLVWEQRKLGDVAAVYDGVHQTPDYQDEGVMFLSVENMATLTSQKFISREAFARDYPVYPKRGDVLMTRIGDIGTSNVVETDDKLAFYVSLALLKPFNVDSYYLDKSLQSPSAKMELYRRTLHTAFPKKINKNQIAEVMLPIPRSRQEQEQIGALFRNLDTLITLHQ